MIDAKTSRLFACLYYLGIIFGAVILYFNRATILPVAFILYGVLAIIMALNHCLFTESKMGKSIVAAELILASFVSYFDNSAFSGIYIVVIILYVIFFYEYRFSIPYTAVAVVCYIAALYIKSPSAALLVVLYQNRTILIPRGIMIFIIIITRNILNVYMKNHRLMILLQEKTQELEAAIQKMREYSDELRETAELRARENLVNELHDNLGHILATASIGAQATGVLMEKSIPEAKRQLEIVTGQIRTAMKTLRSVITGSGGACAEENLPFDESLRCLASETEKHTSAVITCRLPENLDSLSKPVRKFIYYALMEGLTNGLRHGGATGFDFELRKMDKQICFSLQDNGNGFENIKYGFGLTKIQNDAEHIGAQMRITGTEGCLIEFSIPYEKHKKAEAAGNEEN